MPMVSVSFKGSNTGRHLERTTMQSSSQLVVVASELSFIFEKRWKASPNIFVLVAQPERISQVQNMVSIECYFENLAEKLGR